MKAPGVDQVVSVLVMVKRARRGVAGAEYWAEVGVYGEGDRGCSACIVVCVFECV